MRKVTETKEDMIAIKEDIFIGSHILEPDDKIKIIKPIKEEFMELMRDSRGTMAGDLIDSIGDAYRMWKQETRKNYSDSDAQEWGHNSIRDMEAAAKQEVMQYLQDVLEKF